MLQSLSPLSLLLLLLIAHKPQNLILYFFTVQKQYLHSLCVISRNQWNTFFRVELVKDLLWTEGEEEYWSFAAYSYHRGTYWLWSWEDPTTEKEVSVNKKKKCGSSNANSFTKELVSEESTASVWCLRVFGTEVKEAVRGKRYSFSSWSMDSSQFVT